MSQAVSLGQLRQLPNLLDEPERMPEQPTVPVLVALLRSSDEAERDAAAARAAAARRKDGVEARVIGGAHHDGHGIFSAEWTTARTDEEEAEAALVGALEEAPKIRMDTPESIRRFKPIGASTPEVDFRWKTEEEEAREEAVAEFVAGCIQRVIERATVDEEEDAAGTGEEA